MTGGARAAWEELFAGAPPPGSGTAAWLGAWEAEIAACSAPVLDLGCGSGGDTDWLLERGSRVVACDWAESAVAAVRRRYPAVEAALCFDMREGLPFPAGSFGLVVADLSLHYFPWGETREILSDVARVLTPGGALLFRVNAVGDLAYGDGAGEELERHFYRMADGGGKRFFDRQDLEALFAGWRLTRLSEETVPWYGPPKRLWSGCARPR